MSTCLPSRHEPDHVRARGILGALAALVLVLAVVGVSARWLAPGDGVRPAELVSGYPATRDWGEGGVEELRALRRREEEALSSYRWLDAGHTAVSIPIERAMELLASGRSRGREGRP